MNLPGPLDCLEQQIVILRAFQPGLEAMHLVHDRFFDDRQMRDVILREQQIERKVGLEMRPGTFPLQIDFVFIGIDDLRSRGVNGFDDFVESVHRELVIVIHEGQVFAGRDFESFVAGPGNILILVAEDDLDVGFLDLLQIVDGFRIGRAIVDDAEFPVGIDLPSHGIDRLGKPLRIDVVDRHDDGDERLMRKRLAFAFLFGDLGDFAITVAGDEDRLRPELVLDLVIEFSEAGIQALRDQKFDDLLDFHAKALCEALLKPVDRG